MTPAESRTIRLAVLVTAFCVLGYEIALTRVFSVLFRSPLVFLILSIAICGLGLGSFYAGWWRSDDDRFEPLVVPALAFAVLLPVPVLLMLTLAKGLVAGAHGVAVALLTLLPYTAAGVFLSRVFQRASDDAGRLYAYDLTGAALAALATAAVLARIGGIATPLVLGVVAGLSALGLSFRVKPVWRLAAGAWVLVSLGLAAAQLGDGWLKLPALHVPEGSPAAVWAKPLFQELGDPQQGAKVLYTEWSAVARTDVVKDRGIDTLYIWTDGDVPTQMEPFNGDLESVRGYQGFLGFIPYALQPNPSRTLCIGPGGGLDVLLGMLGGAKAIEPVEINPAIVSVTEQFKGFYGDLYRRPQVQPGLIIDEGRSYLSRSPRKYDVIYMALAKSATSQQGGLALVDSFLYTREAFEAYLGHLSETGLLALVFQRHHLIDRCLTTAVSAMLAEGLTGSQIADRVAILGMPPGVFTGPYQHLLLIRRTPFTPAGQRALVELAKERGLQPYWVPGTAENEPYDRLRKDGLTAASFAGDLADQPQYLQRLVRGGPYERLNLSPLNDDKPFYADLSPGLHPFLAKLLGWTTLAGLLALALAMFSGLASRGRGAARLPAKALAGAVLYFAALGAGFLMVEVALIQKLVLLLGYPTLSLSVILFSLLLGGAAGARLANRGTAAAAAARLPGVITTLLLLLLVVRWGVVPLTKSLLPAALWVRVLAAVALTIPLGCLMGQPFPTGLRVLGGQAARLVPLAWAVNGVLSVTGSVIAASAAALWGYGSVLLLGGLVYAAAWAAIWGWLLEAGRTAAVGDGEHGHAD